MSAWARQLMTQSGHQSECRSLSKFRDGVLAKVEANPLLGRLDHCIVPVGSLWGIAMSVDSPRGSTDQSADLPADQSSATDVSRRKALGRLGTYMAPAMLALLMSEQ